MPSKYSARFVTIAVVLLCIIVACIWFSYRQNRQLTHVSESFDTNTGMEGVDQIYWINLDDSTKRRKTMEDMLSDPVFTNVDVIRVSAVNGKEPNALEILNKQYGNIDTTGRYYSPTEYGCTLSHLNCIDAFLKSGKETAIIMEDDMTLEYKDKWQTNIKDVIDNAPEDWQIIMLCYIIPEHMRYAPPDDYTKYARNIWSTGAYLINKSGAKSIMGHSTDPTGKITLNPGSEHYADRYIFNLANTYIYRYPFFIYSYNEQSDIHQEHVKVHDRSRIIIESDVWK